MIGIRPTPAAPRRRGAGPRLAIAVLLAAGAVLARAESAEAGWIVAFQDRSVFAQAEAFSATSSDRRTDEQLAPTAGGFAAIASAAADAGDASGSAVADQSSAIGSSALDAQLGADAAGAVGGAPSTGAFLAESYFDAWLDVQTAGALRLSGLLEAQSSALGDAFASVELVLAVPGGTPVPVFSQEVAFAGQLPFDVTLSLEAGSVYRLTAFALATALVGAGAPGESGAARVSLDLRPVPEPGTAALLAGALGIAAARVRRRAGRQRREEVWV